MIKRLTRVEALERRVHHLESLLAERGIGITTIEQAIHAYLSENAVATAPKVVQFARDHYHLQFKVTSVSVILCRMASLGLIRKKSTPHMAFHTYILRRGKR